jgi:glutathione peroxidase
MSIKMLLALAAAFPLASLGALAQEKAPETPAPAADPAPATPKEVLTGKLKDIDGTEQDLLVVNVASKCGYTHQYAGLETLYQKYKDRGFVILGFPANDFGGQEPGSSDDIKKVCHTKYKVTFPMFEKISVIGASRHAVYEAIASAPLPAGEPPKWNFTKYLIDKDGKVVSSFGSRVKPDDASLARSIEDLLGPATPAAPADAPKSEPADKK